MVDCSNQVQGGLADLTPIVPAGCETIGNGIHKSCPVARFLDGMPNTSISQTSLLIEITSSTTIQNLQDIVPRVQLFEVM